MTTRCTYITAIAALLLSASACCDTQCPSHDDEPQPQPEIRTARLMFAGDVMCHSPQITAARLADGSGDYDFSASFEYVRPLFETADAAIVNFETVVSPDGYYAGYPAFSSPAALANALKNAGVDIAVTANNHCCDRYARGIRTTAATFDALGIARTGAFTDSTDYARNRILRFERNGIRFALLNYTYGTNGIPVPEGCIVNLIDTVRMAADMGDASDADCRIVILHWGEEYQRSTNASQKRIREFLERTGAEIIIGSHPHVIQPAEAAGGRVFASSLGNFVSNQRKRYCDGGLMAEVEVTKQSDTTGVSCRMRLIPVWVKLPGYRIIPPSVADTLPMRADERTLYRQFINDTEKLLYTAKFTDKSN